MENNNRGFVILTILAVCGALGLVLMLGVAIWVWQVDKNWSPLLEPRLRERQDRGSIRVLGETEDGKELWIGSLTSGRLEERQPLRLSDVPPQLVQAIVVLEDPRFLDHEGFDMLGILRAAVVNATKLRYAQGGSTLTQQLVKNVFLTNERTLKRKLTELVLAALIEKRFTKDELLEAYFNEVYLGQLGGVEIRGVARAAQFYFNKKVDQLEVHEMALLAAMIAGPGYYSPFKHPDRTRARRDRVLRQLKEANYILEQEYNEALKQPLPVAAAQSVANSRAAYLLDALKEDLIERLGEIEVVKGGFDVKLSLDLDLQQLAESILTAKSKEWPAEQQALIIGADPQTCEIKVYVGGTHYSITQLDRIRQSARPLGSLIKPLEIAALFEEDEGLSLATVIDDSPFTWSFDKNRQKWSPVNYDRKFRGPVTLRQSIEESLNVPIAKIYFDREPDGLLNQRLDPLRAIGLNIPPDRALPSAVLGAVDQKPRDVALAYVKMVRRSLGLAHDAADLQCDLNFEKKQQDSEQKEYSPESVYGQKGARLIISALEGALRRGTSRALGSFVPENMHWAGKTGTSSDSRDAWYVAVSPKMVLLSWVGRDDNKQTGLTGATGAVPLIRPLIEVINKRVSAESGDFLWPDVDGIKWQLVEDKKGCTPGLSTNIQALHSFPKPETQNGLPTVVSVNEKSLTYELIREDQSLPKCE